MTTQLEQWQERKAHRDRLNHEVFDGTSSHSANMLKQLDRAIDAVAPTPGHELHPAIDDPEDSKLDVYEKWKAQLGNVVDQILDGICERTASDVQRMIAVVESKKPDSADKERPWSAEDVAAALQRGGVVPTAEDIQDPTC